MRQKLSYALWRRNKELIIIACNDFCHVSGLFKQDEFTGRLLIMRSYDFCLKSILTQALQQLMDLNLMGNLITVITLGFLENFCQQSEKNCNKYCYNIWQCIFCYRTSKFQLIGSIGTQIPCFVNGFMHRNTHASDHLPRVQFIYFNYRNDEKKPTKQTKTPLFPYSHR